jgi:signal transduction histidine kinase
MKYAPKDCLRLLVAPAAGIERSGERRRAQLLAGLLLVLVSLGVLSGLVQLATVPNFLPTFLVMTGALTLLAAAYGVARTRAYRLAAIVTCAAPVAACLAVAVHDPDDPVALSFMVLGVLFASVFLSTRAALLTVVAVLAATAVAAIIAPPLRSPDRVVPAVAFQVIVSALLVLAARQRHRIEAEHEARLGETEAMLRRTDEDRRGLQSQLAALTPLATTGRVTAGLAHDLSNLLMLIVHAHREQEPPQEAALRQAELAGEVSIRLIRRMLLLARGGDQPGERTLVDLNTVLQDSEELLTCALGKSCQLVTRYHERPLPVWVDELDLQRILLNLAANARQAMPEGGTVTLETCPADLAPPRSVELPPALYAAIVLADSGTGLPAETMSRTPGPSAPRRGGGGFGLGLGIVADLARRQEALIDVWSQPGQGTRFTIFLPRSAGADWPPRASSQGPAGDRFGG